MTLRIGLQKSSVWGLVLVTYWMCKNIKYTSISGWPEICGGCLEFTISWLRRAWSGDSSRRSWHLMGGVPEILGNRMWIPHLWLHYTYASSTLFRDSLSLWRVVFKDCQKRLTRDYSMFSLLRSPLFRRTPHGDLSNFDQTLTK
jgi:hypothetical protein